MTRVPAGRSAPERSAESADVGASAPGASLAAGGAGVPTAARAAGLAPLLGNRALSRLVSTAPHRTLQRDDALTTFTGHYAQGADEATDALVKRLATIDWAGLPPPAVRIVDKDKYAEENLTTTANYDRKANVIKVRKEGRSSAPPRPGPSTRARRSSSRS